MSADANEDGLLGKDELPLHMHAAHAKADSNGDGKLDPKELTVFLEEFRRNKLRPGGGQPVNRPTNPGSRRPPQTP